MAVVGLLFYFGVLVVYFVLSGGLLSCCSLMVVSGLYCTVCCEFGCFPCILLVLVLFGVLVIFVSVYFGLWCLSW